MNNEIKKIKKRLDVIENIIFNKNEEIAHISSENVDFSLNERAFIKKYSNDFNNGQEFITLVAAYLSRGGEDTSIDLKDIKKVWKNCSGLIGMPYRSSFSTRAKEKGWINYSEESRGFYILGKLWGEILKQDE